MGGAKFLTFLLLAIVPLSGCLGFGDDDKGGEPHDHCEDDSHHTAMNGTDDGAHDDCDDHHNGNGNGNGNGTGNGDGNGTGNVENILPIVNVTVVDDAGESDGITSVGGNFTFTLDASDADGFVELAGIVFTDSNSTRFASFVADDGSFVPVTFDVPKGGPVAVSIRVFDDAGGAASMLFNVYVNIDTTNGPTTDFGLPSPGAGGDSCLPYDPSGTLPGLITNQYHYSGTLTVPRDVSWIEATGSGAGFDVMRICLDGEELTGLAASVSTAPGTPLPPGQYTVYIEAAGPGSAEAAVTLHFEPDTRV